MAPNDREPKPEQGIGRRPEPVVWESSGEQQIRTGARSGMSQREESRGDRHRGGRGGAVGAAPPPQAPGVPGHRRTPPRGQWGSCLVASAIRNGWPWQWPHPSRPRHAENCVAGLQQSSGGAEAQRREEVAEGRGGGNRSISIRAQQEAAETSGLSAPPAGPAPVARLPSAPLAQPNPQQIAARRLLTHPAYPQERDRESWRVFYCA